MRRGSVVTYDEGRRFSAGMVTPDYRSQHDSSRHEFNVHEMGYETTGGCYISYRKIAFVFVFILALVIAGAFIGVHLNSQEDKDVPDVLHILDNEEELLEIYAIAPSIKALSYRIELEPSHTLDESGKLTFEGRVSIDFKQKGIGPDQLVFDSKHLRVKSHRLFIYENAKNSSADADGRRKREDSEVPVTDSTAENGTTSQTDAMDNSVEEPGAKAELKVTGNKTDDAGADYVILLEKPMLDGIYTLEVEYEATVDSRTMFVKNYTKNDEERLLLASKLKPVNAFRLFPTLDEAKLKASFVLTVLHPAGTKVLSNTRLMNSSDVSENKTSDIFAETKPMLPHNLAFVIGNLEQISSTNDVSPSISIYDWIDADPSNSRNSYLDDKVHLIEDAFKGIFDGIDPPSDKLDLVVLPTDFNGLSAPGLIVISESLYDTTPNMPALTKAEALLNLIELVGQQWLGGVVNAKNWTDSWYIDGSVIYFQYAIVDKIDESLEASDNFLVDVHLEAMENDGYLISKALDFKVDRSRIEAFDLADNFKKGACLISMLHAALNESAITTGYADFLRRWSYLSTDSDEFLRALVGNATIEDTSTKVYEAFASWTRQPGYPLINVTWDRENGTLTIRQEKFNFDESLSPDEEDEESETAESSSSESETLWWVPLTYVTSEADWSAPTIAWLKGKAEMQMENVGKGSGNDSWIVFNVDRKGYYRVNYDETTWRSIISVLHEQHDKYPVATRASLVDDAMSLARQGSLDYKIALELLGYLGPSERSYVPWKVLARHALHLDFALYKTPVYSNFRDFMQNLVSTLYDDMEPKIEEGSSLAILALELACSFEYKKCKDWAKNNWMNVKENQTTLAEHVRETVYCIGAEHGSREELDHLMKKFTETSDREEKDRLLSAIGCFQANWVLQKVLNDILETNNYEDSDIKVILLSYAKNPAAAQVAREFLQKNWDVIVKRFSHSYWTMKAFVQASTSLLFTEHDLDEFNTFRDKHIDSLKLMGHWVALNEMKAYSWISRLKDSPNSIQRWFRNHSSSVI